MAYTKDYSWIFDQIRAKNIVAYQLLDEGQKNILAEGDDLTPDTVIAELQTMLPHMGGMVYLVLSAKSKKEKAAGGNVGQNIKIPIQLGTNSAATAPVQGIGSTHTGGMYTQQQVDLLLAEREARHAAELARKEQEHAFNQKMQELETRLNDENRVNPLLEKFAPAINGILTSYFTPKPVAVAGITDAPGAQVHPPHPDETHPLQLQIEQDLDRLLAVDPDFPAALHGLAQLAEENPEMYNMAKSMLPKE